MINGKSVLALIPARGGSKGLSGKNILPLVGKPLIAWTIEAAKGSKYIDRLLISTDDKEIADVANKYGCEVPFLRPADLATDVANIPDTILHALEMTDDQYNIIILLQPTSPLRKSSDIDSALELILGKEINAVVSVCLSSKPLHWHHTLERNGRLLPVGNPLGKETNRQQFNKTYLPNGALFLAKTLFFLKKKAFYTESTYAYIMPPERSIDVDSLMDLKLAEWILTERC